ncbi:ASCH domain-containing protein [Sporosarcina thermotolerans]|uniref:ASCH domain-containing protein n=1 Tax=Sporosarcina thermotolerans TaxID=633404 RepID=A0AAW9A554_9BACL|nr:ASCH domain-containing protein [Sporosarcina thermotolerans]
MFGEAVDELAQAVIEGRKTATCSAHVLYELEKEPIPVVNEYSIILNSLNEPVAIIKTVDVSIIPMNEVTEEFALAEGDGSYRNWKEIHERYFKRELGKVGLKFTEDILLVCERFELVDVKQKSTNRLLRVGITYIPVSNVELAAEWYVEKLDAELSYRDEDKAIINLTDQSFFLVKAKESQTANFLDVYGNERFSLTFEVDGEEALKRIHEQFIKIDVSVGEIEKRGHAGVNFVFSDLDGNQFDVWSELSPSFNKDRN